MSNTSQMYKEVMAYLKEKGNPNTVKIYRNHGATSGEMFGVKIGDLKPMQKKHKGNGDLARQLFNSGNSDAMYLACLIMDAKELSIEELRNWMHSAWWYMLSEYAVAWLVAESPFAKEVISEFIESDQESVAAGGWSALSSYLSITADEQLDTKYLSQLLNRVVTDIHAAPNRVRYTMNGFVISLGGYVAPLLEEAKAAAEQIGKVEVFMGKTSCKVPFAPDYIAKMESKNRIGKKRKTAKC